MISKVALSILLLQLSNSGLDAFVPSALGHRIVRPRTAAGTSISLNVATEPPAVANANDEEEIDAPDHMPELQDIAPTYSAKSENTAFERYKSDYALSLSQNKQYWNQRANDLLSWEHYPFDESNCEGIMTGAFEHGDVAWFPGK